MHTMAGTQAPYVICYLCGRKYGTKSILIHEPNCLKNWFVENKKLPKHLRRKQPPLKPDYSQLLAGGNVNEGILDQINEISYKAAQAQLIPCDNCGRTFLPERLQVHQKSCTFENPAAPPKPGTKINGVRISKNAGTANIIKAFEGDEERVQSVHRSINQKTRSTTNESLPATLPIRQKEKTIIFNNEIKNNENYIACSFCDLDVPISKIQTHLVRCNQEERILCGLCQREIPASQIQKHLVKCNQARLNKIKSSNDSGLVLPMKHLSKSYDNNKNQQDILRNEQSISSDELNSRANNSNELSFKKKASLGQAIQDHEDINKVLSKNPIVKSEKLFQPQPNYDTYDKCSSSEDNDDNDDVNMIECDVCKRFFALNRIDKHKSICLKMKQKKRKVFDSAKQRAQGSDAKQLSQNARPQTKHSILKSDWRQKHNEFISSIRAARKVKAHIDNGGKASDLPPPPPSLNLDYIECQHCSRRFNPTVAERHIPKCASILNKPQPPKQRAIDLLNNSDAYNQSNSVAKIKYFSKNPISKPLSLASNSFTTNKSPRYSDFHEAQEVFQPGWLQL